MTLRKMPSQENRRMASNGENEAPAEPWVVCGTMAQRELRRPSLATP
ncbi:MAG: hypothetical protein ACYC0V_11540 [Armatimonadota bacterium]